MSAAPCPKKEGFVSGLKRRLGADAFSVLHAASLSYQENETTAQDYYDLGIDILQGDSESLLKLVGLLKDSSKRDAVLAIHSHRAHTSRADATPLATALASTADLVGVPGGPPTQPPPAPRGSGILAAPPCSLRPLQAGTAAAPGAAGATSAAASAAMAADAAMALALSMADGCSVDDDEGCCPVCFEPRPDLVQISPCAHVLCRECLQLWRGTSAGAGQVSAAAGAGGAGGTGGAGAATCPLCRGPIRGYGHVAPAASAAGPSAASAAAVAAGKGSGPNAAKSRSRGKGEEAGGAAASPVIMWYRSDLRISDNPALLAAAKLGPVIPVFIYAPEEDGEWPLGGASRLWLHRSLCSLDGDLRRRFGSRLLLRRAPPAAAGGSAAALVALMRETGASTVVWNRTYEPWLLRRDAAAEAAVAAAGGRGRSFAAAVMYEPWDAKPDADDEGVWNGGFGSVGWFMRAAELLGPPPPPVPAPTRLRAPPAWPGGEQLAALGAAMGVAPACPGSPGHPGSPGSPGFPGLPVSRTTGKLVDWTAPILAAWTVGEEGANAALELFASEGLRVFDSKSVQAEGAPESADRFRADLGKTARISPHVRFGEISPRQVFARCVEAAAAGGGRGGERSARVFLRRLMWRDLFYWMLWKFPDLPTRPLRPAYAAQWWDHSWDHRTDCPAAALAPEAALLRWAPEHAGLRAWQRGRTGYPLVDAAMRELWQTGWLSNYMRHVTASFLVEYLNVDWRHGLLWYHDTLVDADVAINSSMWQNCGHSGADQWNFVMHPVFAAKSADPEGAYVRRWAPELAKLPAPFIHAPWEAQPAALAAAGVVLGRSYPRRVVADLEGALRRSLRAVNEVRAGPGAAAVLPDGNESLALPDGRRARLITRVDYRAGAAEPVTRQAPAPAWDARRRARTDPLGLAMSETVSQSERARGMGVARRFG